jgi:glucose/arabinose dehydrogenase
MPNARSLALGDKGTVFVGSRLVDKVYAIVDKDGKREVKVVASGLYRPNGVAFKNGTLYIAGAVADLEDRRHRGQARQSAQAHRHLQRPAEGRGARLEVSRHRARQQALFRGWPALQQLHPIRQARAAAADQSRRQRCGSHSARRPQHGGLRLAPDLEGDVLHRQQPRLDVGRAAQRRAQPHHQVGQHFGSPFCYQGNLPDPEFGWGRSCSEFEPPIALMGPHTAALGMKFYTGNQFPAKYKNQALIARHGSWNKSNKIGGDVVLVNIKKDGTAGTIEPFVTGFLENNTYVGRPVDVMVMKDGSVLISDDWNGAVWKVSYGNARTAGR